MWIQLLILFILGLIGGSIYYYFLIYSKSWDNINIWTKLGLIGIIIFELIIILTGILYSIISKRNKIPVLSGAPPNRPGPEIFEYFESQNLEEPLGGILQFLLLKLFEPDFNSNPVEFDRREIETLKIKLDGFIKFYRRNKTALIRDFEFRNEYPSFITKYIFYIAPSNRIIAYFFSTIDNYIMVERPDSTRMSQDFQIRDLCRKYAQSMITILKTEGFHKIPSAEVIDTARNYYEFISSINRYAPPEISSDIKPISDEFVDPLNYSSRI